MAIPSMFQGALTLITTTVTSTAKNGLTRVLSFTGSFNDRTSLLLAAAPAPAGLVPDEQEAPTLPPPPSPSQEVATGGATSFDIEADTQAGGGGSGEPTTTQQDAEAKRVAKSVQTVCLFAASASLVLFVNLPPKPGDAAAGEAEKHGGGAVLYIADMGFICLALFTSLGLSMYSIMARSSGTDPAVARVQKRAMVMAVAFVLVSFTLRVCMMLPAAALESSAWLVFVLLAGAVAVFLALAWRIGGAARSAEVATSGSGAGAGAHDRV